MLDSGTVRTTEPVSSIVSSNYTTINPAYDQKFDVYVAPAVPKEDDAVTQGSQKEVPRPIFYPYVGIGYLRNSLDTSPTPSISPQDCVAHQHSQPEHTSFYPGQHSYLGSRTLPQPFHYFPHSPLNNTLPLVQADETIQQSANQIDISKLCDVVNSAAATDALPKPFESSHLDVSADKPSSLRKICPEDSHNESEAVNQLLMSPPPSKFHLGVQPTTPQTPRTPLLNKLTPSCDSASKSGSSDGKRGRPRADFISTLILEGTASPNIKYQCGACQRVFPRDKSLQSHMRTHTGEKPYTCDFPGCQKAFCQGGQLRTHQRLHTGESPYTCAHPDCEQVFRHANRHCAQHPDLGLERTNTEKYLIMRVQAEEQSLVKAWLERYLQHRHGTSRSDSPDPDEENTSPSATRRRLWDDSEQATADTKVNLACSQSSDDKENDVAKSTSRSRRRTRKDKPLQVLSNICSAQQLFEKDSVFEDNPSPLPKPFASIRDPSDPSKTRSSGSAEMLGALALIELSKPDFL